LANPIPSPKKNRFAGTGQQLLAGAEHQAAGNRLKQLERGECLVTAQRIGVETFNLGQ